jgi:hypothetical protein
VGGDTGSAQLAAAEQAGSVFLGGVAMLEERLPLRLELSPQARAQRAFDDALEAFAGPREAIVAIGGFIKRQKEARKSMAYDQRWRGARDQGEPGGGENLEDLASMLKELIGEDNAAKCLSQKSPSS